MTHPLAALIAGVPRHTIRCYVDDLPCLLEKDVLAALEAAPVPDLVEAGKVADRLDGYEIYDRPGPGFMSNAADTIRALIALANAQAAQIAGLQTDNEALKSARDMLGGYWNKATARAETAEQLAQERLDHIVAAEAEAATLRDEVERLRGALDRVKKAWPLVRDTDCTGGKLASAIEEIEATLEGKT